jgi:hypothetical protein
LDLQEGDDFGESEATPGTSEERELVHEFLTRYRAEDPEIQPIVDQLWRWMAQRDEKVEREIQQRKAAKILRPTVRDRVLNPPPLGEKEDRDKTK